MTNKRLAFGRYKIVLVRLDLLHSWLYNFMILQLPFFLDTSFNKHIAFEIIVLIGINLLNSMEN